MSDTAAAETNSASQGTESQGRRSRTEPGRGRLFSRSSLALLPVILLTQKILPDRRKRHLTVATPLPRGISERNRSLLTLLTRAVDGPFTVDDAAQALSLSTSRTHRVLAQLAERGWLVRVHRGLYDTVPLETLNPARWQADPWSVAAKRFGPDYYIGGWSAAEHWGLTEQIFRTTIVFTTRRVRNREQEIQGLPLRIKHVSNAKIFGLRPVWRERTCVNLSDPARTIVDLLDDPSMAGGIRHLTEIVDTYFEGEHRDDLRLLEDLDLLGNRSCYKRLGYLLEVLDIDAPDAIETCQTHLSAGVSLLDPSAPSAGSVSRRWNLRLNVAVAAEHTEP